MPIGTSAVVSEVGGDARNSTRLMEMGVLPGTTLVPVRRAPLGDPLEVRLRGYSLTLRESEASRILVCRGAPEGEAVARPKVSLPRALSGTSEPSSSRRRRVVLAGNPNVGKTTLFNGLTGARLPVANYPGTTVELRSGVLPLGSGESAELLDLPGIYSLSARSPEEQIAADAILGRAVPAPDAVIVVVDATTLERSLYLAHQVIETGIPVVLALNLMDEAREAGIEIDVEGLGERLGVEVVPTTASTGSGFGHLMEAARRATRRQPATEPVDLGLGEGFERALVAVEKELHWWSYGDCPVRRRAWGLWSLLSVDEDELLDVPPELRSVVLRMRSWYQEQGGNLVEEVVAARYGNIEAILDEVRVLPSVLSRHWTERLDALLIHRVFGLVCFTLVMACLFEAIFSWFEPLTGLLEVGITMLQGWVVGAMDAGPFRDLLTEGVIAGVGNVLVFAPQIALLFLFLGFLEDSGYLARVAFVIDRLMGGVGLNGKAFVPMLSGFACAVPAVMATRTIENQKDRLLTMLAVPLVSCSARLPVYVLVSAVVFPAQAKVFGVMSLGAFALLSMYILSLALALLAAAAIRRTVLNAPRPTQILELPPYRMPVLGNLVWQTWERLRSFLVDAGSIILAMTIVIWFLLSFPKNELLAWDLSTRIRALEKREMSVEARTEAKVALENEFARRQLAHSYAGELGRGLEPVIEPLGFDWRIGIGIIGAFAAREVFVSTLGTVFGIENADEESVPLRESLTRARWPDGSPLLTPLAGVSLMIFFVIACQCMSTVAVVRRESGSWAWTAFMFGYMTSLAYLASLAVFQVGTMMEWGIR